MSADERATPLCDEAELDNSNFSDWGTGPSGYVSADFARTLERSRAELIECIEKYEGEYSNPSPDLILRAHYRGKLFAALAKVKP